MTTAKVMTAARLMNTFARPPSTCNDHVPSLTCPFAVLLLTLGATAAAAASAVLQSRACKSRLAWRQSTHSQTVNPMIQAGTRMIRSALSAPWLYTLASC